MVTNKKRELNHYKRQVARASVSDKVKIFCPICNNGNNKIWEGSFSEWGNQLGLIIPPDWYLYAMRHEKAHNHRIVIKYPSGRQHFLKHKTALDPWDKSIKNSMRNINGS